MPRSTRWFRQPRALEEIQTFDDASRGPMGAAKLVMQTSAFHLATLGGIITILALVMDPFAQQILAYPSRNVLSGRAEVWRAQSYDEQVDLSSCKYTFEFLLNLLSENPYADTFT